MTKRVVVPLTEVRKWGRDCFLGGVSLSSDTLALGQNCESDEQIAGNVELVFERGQFTLDMWS